MSLQDFIARYTGKSADFDGYYGAQCVDLAQFYAKELGAPRFWGNAKDIAGQTQGWWTWIPNTAGGSPNPGDVVIWDGRVGGGAGHIAIAVSGNKNGFTSFDQNWPTNSLPHLQAHDYYAVVGWLRPKTAISTGGNALPWSDDQYLPYAEDHARLAYQTHMGRRPTRDEQRARLGLAWSEEYNAIKNSPEAYNATKEFVLDAFAGILLRKREVGDGPNQVSKAELDARIADLLNSKYTPQQLQHEFLNSGERKTKMDSLSKQGVDVPTVESNFIARIMANVGTFLNGLRTK